MQPVQQALLPLVRSDADLLPIRGYMPQLWLVRSCKMTIIWIRYMTTLTLALLLGGAAVYVNVLAVHWWFGFTYTVGAVVALSFITEKLEQLHGDADRNRFG